MFVRDWIVILISFSYFIPKWCIYKSYYFCTFLMFSNPGMQCLKYEPYGYKAVTHWKISANFIRSQKIEWFLNHCRTHRLKYNWASSGKPFVIIYNILRIFIWSYKIFPKLNIPISYFCKGRRFAIGKQWYRCFLLCNSMNKVEYQYGEHKCDNSLCPFTVLIREH